MTADDGCFAMVAEEGGSQLYRLRVDPLEAYSAVGSGDAFLAGYVAARYTGRPPAECLRFGVACGAESTQHIGAGVIDPREAERLESEIAVEPVEIPAEVSLGEPLQCLHGSRDRTRQEGATRLRVRRHRHRPLAPHARPRRHRHLLEARPLPLRAPAARRRDGRRRLPADRRRSSAAWAGWPCSTSRASGPATRTPTSSSSGSPQLPKELATREMQEIYAEPIKPELIAAADRRDQGAGRRRGGLAHAAAGAPLLRGSRSRPASTCSSSRARSSRPSTSPPTSRARR